MVLEIVKTIVYFPLETKKTCLIIRTPLIESDLNNKWNECLCLQNKVILRFLI